jgi:DNA repair protein RecN (Recombination protein N)
VLTLLKIKNIALIDGLELEFGRGLNLLTGETGSGKSIIVDSLGALIGDRVSIDLIKEGEKTATIEGLFSTAASKELIEILDESGITIDLGSENEFIIRREISATGKNRIFFNGQLVTQGFLKRIGIYLADIYGQGDQTGIYDVETHIELLDQFADVEILKTKVAGHFRSLASIRGRLASIEKDTAQKLQLVDILRFQVSEIGAASLAPDEETSLEEEKLRLANVEKLTSLSNEAFALLYDNAESTATTLEKAQRKISELADFDSQFASYAEGITTARAVIEDLAFCVRDFRSKLEFSPERLDEIETRLAEILRLKRKYGGTVEAVIEHLRISEERLANIENTEFREEELRKQLALERTEYVAAATELTKARKLAAAKFERQVEQNMRAVALDKARFEVRFDSNADDDDTFTENGIDRVEFYFSANPGESPRPLARVASGGEASRVMLILKTTIDERGPNKTAVFDEVDVGIGGRVAEAVGRKLKDLSQTQQILCVTHQPQIASLADSHFVVEKDTSGEKTSVSVRKLTNVERIDEIARMLAGEHITEAARENAKSMLAGN